MDKKQVLPSFIHVLERRSIFRSFSVHFLVMHFPGRDQPLTSIRRVSFRACSLFGRLTVKMNLYFQPVAGIS